MNWNEVTDTLNRKHIARVFLAHNITLAGGWYTVSRGVVLKHMLALCPCEGRLAPHPECPQHKDEDFA